MRLQATSHGPPEPADAADVELALMPMLERAKMAVAAMIYRRRALNRWAHRLLPTKRLAAGVLLFDRHGRLLLVKPSYRDDWLIPGGVVERNEPPWEGARREVLEEVGIEVGRLRLIAVDWRAADDEYDDSLHFLFAGGELSVDQQARIRCDGIEIERHLFATREEAARLMEPDLCRRVMPCWDGGSERPIIMNRGRLAEDVR